MITQKLPTILDHADNGLVDFSREKQLIELPFPPSTNSYWRHVMIGKHPRTLISERGRAFRKTVQDEVLVLNPGLLSGPLRCQIDLYPPCNRRRDCDNYAKALLDALTHASVYHDDSQIIDLRIRMHAKRPPGSVVITLEPIRAEHCAHNQIDLLAG